MKRLARGIVWMAAVGSMLVLLVIVAFWVRGHVILDLWRYTTARECCGIIERVARWNGHC